MDLFLAATSTGGSYTWIPAQNLVAATNYALEIKQSDQTNFIGPFSLAGGIAFSSTAPPASASATTPAYDASSSSLLSAFSSLSSVLSSNANLALTTMTPSSYAALPVASGTGGIPVLRNTTFQSATFSPANTGNLNPTVGVSVTPGATQSAAATDVTPATGTSGASSARIPVALIVGAITAAMYLT